MTSMDAVSTLPIESTTNRASTSPSTPAFESRVGYAGDALPGSGATIRSTVAAV
jgi:hypothetical protein